MHENFPIPAEDFFLNNDSDIHQIESLQIPLSQNKEKIDNSAKN